MTNKAGMELRITLHQICIAGDLSWIWYTIKTLTFAVKYTYFLLTVAVLQSKSETDKFYDERFLPIHTLGCIGILLPLRVT